MYIIRTDVHEEEYGIWHLTVVANYGFLLDSIIGVVRTFIVISAKAVKSFFKIASSISFILLGTITSARY